MTNAFECPRVDDAVLAKAHDVRTLVRCASCGGVGNKPHMLSGLEAASGLEGWHHGICVVRRLGAEGVVKLPAAEREKLRLGDTGVELMRTLLDLRQDDATARD
ncbi:hypothetical protein A9R05_42510 (plasmid) [Burkholderia sp. KK1]|uniref:hypothetical protein n=1 Tax=Burkholderia sp. M701 TaxID=326454 RepID=UPI000979A6FC|nr:hypothetical protein [Burkholderia sp. M701]AQH05694.1 hypothetical protein A9R05_42510 [Burkholderia sp. KK1]